MLLEPESKKEGLGLYIALKLLYLYVVGNGGAYEVVE